MLNIEALVYKMNSTLGKGAFIYKLALRTAKHQCAAVKPFYKVNIF